MQLEPFLLLVISSVCAVMTFIALNKIWVKLATNPGLRRNEHLMWVNLAAQVLFAGIYAVVFVIDFSDT